MTSATLSGLSVTRFDEARPYEAPNHHLVRSLRLQGLDAGGAPNFWVGLSHILPGGGAGPDASPLEKVYVVLSGEVVVICGGTEVTLRALDSCTIAANAEREMINRTNAVASMVVVMPTPRALP